MLTRETMKILASLQETLANNNQDELDFSEEQSTAHVGVKENAQVFLNMTYPRKNSKYLNSSLINQN